MANRQPVVVVVDAGEGDRLGGIKLGRLVDAQDASQQALGVRMTGPVEQILDRGLFHDLAGVHHGDALADLADDAQVVGDQQQRGADLGLDVP